MLFSFGLGGAELVGIEMNSFALPLGLVLFAVVIGVRVWVRRSYDSSQPSLRNVAIS